MEFSRPEYRRGHPFPSPGDLPNSQIKSRPPALKADSLPAEPHTGAHTGVGSHSLLHGIFPTQGSNPGLPHFAQILYQLSHKGSPRILEWVAYPFFSGSSWPRNRTQEPDPGICIAGRFFTSWATREALDSLDTFQLYGHVFFLSYSYRPHL